ncbi:hypothetical protein MUU72_12005 [Streptomyces sp. RS10V-4]|uniref:hypothetical protein n=1 Tax=Streptomyces rhizoryzae TaxID=2932493 RepID=UPI0020061E04|nr:hypothetical protein [Streptomyces rhizoryzae]MCK7623812.1 hypothetical protein [Streptomyces rhizoryzae]
MRTRMAAGAVVAATLLTLTGSTVAVADGKDAPRRTKDSPIQMAACALGTALGALTGGDANCVRDRLAHARDEGARENRGEHRRTGQAHRDDLGRSDGLGRADDVNRGEGLNRTDGLGRADDMGRGETLPRM